jgi:hypothetical protein
MKSARMPLRDWNACLSWRIILKRSATKTVPPAPAAKYSHPRRRSCTLRGRCKYRDSSLNCWTCAGTGDVISRASAKRSRIFSTRPIRYLVSRPMLTGSRMKAEPTISPAQAPLRKPSQMAIATPNKAAIHVLPKSERIFLAASAAPHPQFLQNAALADERPSVTLVVCDPQRGQLLLIVGYWAAGSAAGCIPCCGTS